VVEKSGQVVIVIRSERDEHLAVHRMADGPVMFTHSSPDKPPGAWDATRAEIARKLGFRNPGKHAHYYAHRPLFPEPIVGMDGHVLVERRVRIEAGSPPAKYANTPRIVVDAGAPEFMLGVHLSTPGQPYSSPEEPHVATAFGALYFRPVS